MYWCELVWSILVINEQYLSYEVVVFVGARIFC